VEHDNVEVVRRSFDAWNEGDPDVYMEQYAADVVVETPPNFPEGGTLEGNDELRRFFGSLREGWEGGSSVTVAELTPVSDDRVFADFKWHGTGETSGVEAALETVGLFTVSAGKIVRAQFFFDRAAGLMAAGLED
jgi:ketosteroid isomerase-like protein